MSLLSSCIAVCAPMTAIASVLLFMMAHMLRSGNWTFEVLAAKHDWEKSEKADVCRRGALLYLFTSLALWAVMVLLAPLHRLWLCMPWRRRQRAADERNTREGLLELETRSAATPDTVHGRGLSSGTARPSLGRVNIVAEEEAEQSALDWGHDDLRRPFPNAKSSVLAPNGSSLLGSSRPEMAKGVEGGAAGATASNGRAFPDFLRSLAEAGRGMSSSSGGGGGVGGGGGDVAGTSSSSILNRARGLRGRAQQAGTADAQGTVTIRPDFVPGGSASSGSAAPSAFASAQTHLPSPQLQRRQQPQQQQQQHATLWSSGADHDSVDDSDFLSDVEMDGHRHSGLRQIRASGWAKRRESTNTTLSSRGMRTPGALSSGRGAGASAGAAGQPAPVLTTLWPAPANASPPSSPSPNLTGSGQYGVSNAGPPRAMKRSKNGHKGEK